MSFDETFASVRKLPYELNTFCCLTIANYRVDIKIQIWALEARCRAANLVLFIHVLLSFLCLWHYYDGSLFCVL